MNPRYMRATKATTTTTSAAAAVLSTLLPQPLPLLLQHQIAIEVQPKGKRHQQNIKTTLK